MIDINYIRGSYKKVKELILKRGNPEKADIDLWFELDKTRRSLINKLGLVNNQRNHIAKESKGNLTDTNRELARKYKEEITDIQQDIDEITVRWQEILDWIPNIPLHSKFENMPEGESDADNIILKAWTPQSGYITEVVGEKARGKSEKYMPDFPLHADEKDFTPKLHLELGTLLGWIDSDQAAKVSGSRFTYLVGDIVHLQYALQRFVMDELFNRGFTPIIPPLLVKERALYGSSHFPEGKDQVYAIKNDNVEEGNQLYLLGSSEPANFAYFMDKTIDEKDLPIKLVAYAPALRSEAGSWGRDTRGIKRLHQFDKIEMDIICHPENSEAIFDELLGINEWLLQNLELPYQLALKCTADAGYHASAKQVDPECWLPVQNEFMEIGTDTNATDFQARRLNIKYKDKQGNKALVHTVNDTGVAMGRMLICILEHYQQKDGKVKIPKVLRKYFNKEYLG
jgi:seryl-tRNA synthetase